MNYFLIGLGSNINPDANIPAAKKALQSVGDLVAQSDVLINPPCGQGFDGLFHNQLLILASDFSETELKTRFESMEIALGREAKTPQRKFNNRTIDIDILANGDSIESCLMTELNDSYNQTIMASWQPEQRINP